MRPTCTSIDLQWLPSPTAGVTYSVYRASTPFFTPSDANRIAGNLQPQFPQGPITYTVIAG